MAQGQFQLSEVNPNDSTGGGGCICDVEKQIDCKPPYVVCYGNEMGNPVSPHVVACAACISEMASLVESGEQAVVGNRGDDQTVNPQQLLDPYGERAVKAERKATRKRNEDAKPAI